MQVSKGSQQGLNSNKRETSLNHDSYNNDYCKVVVLFYSQVYYALDLMVTTQNYRYMHIVNSGNCYMHIVFRVNLITYTVNKRYVADGEKKMLVPSLNG